MIIYNILTWTILLRLSILFVLLKKKEYIFEVLFVSNLVEVRGRPSFSRFCCC